MLKKRRHRRFTRRNTEPSVNNPIVISTGAKEKEAEPPVNLADICDSPTHATAV